MKWCLYFVRLSNGLMALQEGQKAIYHLEAFVAKMMSEYKTWSIAVLG